MKKLVLMAVAIVAVSFASCGGNKAANTEATETAAPARAQAPRLFLCPYARNPGRDLSTLNRDLTALKRHFG